MARSSRPQSGRPPLANPYAVVDGPTRSGRAAAAGAVLAGAAGLAVLGAGTASADEWDAGPGGVVDAPPTGSATGGTALLPDPDPIDGTSAGSGDDGGSGSGSGELSVLEPPTGLTPGDGVGSLPDPSPRPGSAPAQWPTGEGSGDGTGPAAIAATGGVADGDDPVPDTSVLDTSSAVDLEVAVAGGDLGTTDPCTTSVLDAALGLGDPGAVDPCATAPGQDPADPGPAAAVPADTPAGYPVETPVDDPVEEIAAGGTGTVLDGTGAVEEQTGTVADDASAGDGTPSGDVAPGSDQDDTVTPPVPSPGDGAGSRDAEGAPDPAAPAAGGGAPVEDVLATGGPPTPSSGGPAGDAEPSVPWWSDPDLVGLGSDGEPLPSAFLFPDIGRRERLSSAEINPTVVVGQLDARPRTKAQQEALELAELRALELAAVKHVDHSTMVGRMAEDVLTMYRPPQVGQQLSNALTQMRSRYDGGIPDFGDVSPEALTAATLQLGLRANSSFRPDPAPVRALAGALGELATSTGEITPRQLDRLTGLLDQSRALEDEAVRLAQENAATSRLRIGDDAEVDQAVRFLRSICGDTATANALCAPLDEGVVGRGRVAVDEPGRVPRGVLPEQVQPLVRNVLPVVQGILDGSASPRTVLKLETWIQEINTGLTATLPEGVPNELPRDAERRQALDRAATARVRVIDAAREDPGSAAAGTAYGDYLGAISQLTDAMGIVRDGSGVVVPPPRGDEVAHSGDPVPVLAQSERTAAEAIFRTLGNPMTQRSPLLDQLTRVPLKLPPPQADVTSSAADTPRRAPGGGEDGTGPGAGGERDSRAEARGSLPGGAGRREEPAGTGSPVPAGESGSPQVPDPDPGGTVHRPDPLPDPEIENPAGRPAAVPPIDEPGPHRTPEPEPVDPREDAAPGTFPGGADGATWDLPGSVPGLWIHPRGEPVSAGDLVLDVATQDPDRAAPRPAVSPALVGPVRGVDPAVLRSVPPAAPDPFGTVELDTTLPAAAVTVPAARTRGRGTVATGPASPAAAAAPDLSTAVFDEDLDATGAVVAGGSGTLARGSTPAGAAVAPDPATAEEPEIEVIATGSRPAGWLDHAGRMAQQAGRAAREIYDAQPFTVTALPDTSDGRQVTRVAFMNGDVGVYVDGTRVSGRGPDRFSALRTATPGRVLDDLGRIIENLPPLPIPAWNPFGQYGY